MLRLSLILSAAALVAACSSAPVGGSYSTGADAAAMPKDALGSSTLPPNAVIKAEQSLIIGAGDQWVGRVVADVGRDSEGTFRYYLDSYPAQGWTLISSVRGRTSLLVFTKQDRTAVVELTEGGLVGSGLVTVTVSPRNAAVVAPRKN